MSSSEEEEEFLIHVEFNEMLDKDALDRSRVFFKMIGVDGKRPVMQIGNQTFAGEYRDVVGTALFFEEDPTPPGGDPVFTKTPEHQLRYVCKTRKALQMSRVFLRRRNSAEDIDSKCEDDSSLDPDVDTAGNSTAKSQKTGSKDIHNNSSDERMMEIEENHPPASTRKKRAARYHELEPVAGPSWMSDVPDSDVRDLGTLMEATASKFVSHEMSRLIEKQLEITTDGVRNLGTDSDSVSDD